MAKANSAPGQRRLRVWTGGVGVTAGSSCEGVACMKASPWLSVAGAVPVDQRAKLGLTTLAGNRSVAMHKARELNLKFCKAFVRMRRLAQLRPLKAATAGCQSATHQPLDGTAGHRDVFTFKLAPSLPCALDLKRQTRIAARAKRRVG